MAATDKTPAPLPPAGEIVVFEQRDEAGVLVRGVAQAQPGRELSVQVADGSFAVTVAGAGPARAAGPRRRASSGPDQADLF